MSAGHDAIISRHSLPPGCTFPSLPPSARDRNIALAESLLAMNKALAGDVPSEERPQLEAACEEADREIDQTVYALYGLTEEMVDVAPGNRATLCALRTHGGDSGCGGGGLMQTGGHRR